MNYPQQFPCLQKKNQNIIWNIKRFMTFPFYVHLNWLLNPTWFIKKTYHIPFSFYLGANILIWPLHQNNLLSATDPCLMHFDSSILLISILMLWTDIGTKGKFHLCIGQLWSQLMWSGVSMIFWSSIYYIHFCIIHSTIALYSHFLPSYQPYHTHK